MREAFLRFQSGKCETNHETFAGNKTRRISWRLANDEGEEFRRKKNVITSSQIILGGKFLERWPMVQSSKLF